MLKPGNELGRKRHRLWQLGVGCDDYFSKKHDVCLEKEKDAVEKKKKIREFDSRHVDSEDQGSLPSVSFSPFLPPFPAKT